MAQKWPKMAQKLAPAEKNSTDISAASATFCISVSETFSCLLLSRDWKSWMKSLASNEQWVETNVYICHPLLLLQEWAEWTLTQHLCRSNSQNLVCRDVIASKNYSFNHPVIKPSTSSLSTTEWCFFLPFPLCCFFWRGWVVRLALSAGFLENPRWPPWYTDGWLQRPEYGRAVTWDNKMRPFQIFIFSWISNAHSMNKIMMISKHA